MINETVCPQENISQNLSVMPLITRKLDVIINGIERQLKEEEWKKRGISKPKTIKDLTGLKINKLKVLKLVGKDKFGRIEWDCLCDCGRMVRVANCRLLRKEAKACGCLNLEPKDIKGRVFGKLIAIEGIYPGEGGTKWKCLCECGKYVTVFLSNLLRGGHKTCGCGWLKRKPGEAGLQIIFHGYERGAMKRGLEFSISKDQFAEITSKDCYYCGRPPAQGKNNCHVKKSARSRYIHNGIDRVDNTKGYIYENCVPCCRYCNQAKSDLELTKFFKLIESIYNKHLKIK